MLGKDKEQWMERVNTLLDDVRPHLAEDGGDIEVVDIMDDMSVKVKWLGTCENCGMSAMTLKAGVEQAIRQKFPEIPQVIPINGMGNFH